MGASSSRSSTVAVQGRLGPEDQSGFTVVNSNQQGYQPATVYNNGPRTGRVQYTQQPAAAGFYGQQQPQQPQQPQQVTEKKKTKTIRNDVNLKKHTLKLVQDESDPSVYYPTFKFDCGAPCSVSVF